MSLRAVKCLSSKRVTDSTFDHLKHFSIFLEDWYYRNKNKKYIIVNADETRITLDVKRANNKLIESLVKERPGYTGLNSNAVATYLPFISPKEILFSVFLLPIDKNNYVDLTLKLVNDVNKCNHPVYFMGTRGGYVNSDAWTAILEVFQIFMKTKYPEYEICLFFDRLSSHMTIESLSFCKNANIDAICFPANSTHVIQPCDSLIFASFKNSIHKMVRNMMTFTEFGERKLGSLLLETANKAISAITPKVIAESFSRTGIYPFSKAKILSNSKKLSGEVNIENESTKSRFSRELTMKIIKGQCNDALMFNPIKIKLNDKHLYSGIDILKEKEKEQENRKRKAKNSSTKSVNAVRKRSRPQTLKQPTFNENEEIRCCYQGHKSKNQCSNMDFHSCNYCNKYYFCNTCYNMAIEVFILHEEECLMKSKNKKRRKNIEISCS